MESPTLTTKQCPDCAEQVQQAARVCRHCGYRFDGLVGVHSLRSRDFHPANGHHPHAGTTPEPRQFDAFAIVGLVAAFLVPIVGFIIGIVLLSRRQNTSGLIVLIVSITMFFVGCALILGSA